NVLVMNGGNGVQNLECSVSAIFMRNNIITANAHDGAQVLPNFCSTSSFSAVFTNNIVTDNGGCGLDLNNIASGGQQISYNDVFGNATNYCGSAAAGTGDISQIPRFVDTSSGDYRLLSTSSCLNAGTPGLNLDPDGTRNDIGAFGGPGAADFFPGPGNP